MMLAMPRGRLQLALAMLVAPAIPLAGQTPVGATAAASDALEQAQVWLDRGQRDSATELLGRHLAAERNDGRAWLFLGRIYLDQAERWHRIGHPDSISETSMLDFAGTSFEPAQELLTDSGGVFRVMVAVERATLRIEREGWDSVATTAVSADEVPLPPVLFELGRNLLSSCPQRGILLTGSLTETAAVWGVRLTGVRQDLILVRPDLYRDDARYRTRMAAVIGVDPGQDLGSALVLASARHPVCLSPSVDSAAAPHVNWHADRLVLASANPDSSPVTALSVFHFGRTGLAGSVWTASARDVYDLAARRNPELCRSLFISTAGLTLPAIPACTR